MRHTGKCPKCGGAALRIPDGAHRYLANSIPITRGPWVTRVPVDRYVCEACGYVENWVEEKEGLERLKKEFGEDR